MLSVCWLHVKDNPYSIALVLLLQQLEVQGLRHFVAMAYHELHDKQFEPPHTGLPAGTYLPPLPTLSPTRPPGLPIDPPIHLPALHTCLPAGTLLQVLLLLWLLALRT